MVLHLVAVPYKIQRFLYCLLFYILSSPANPHKFARKASCSCAYFTLQTSVIIEMKSQFKKYIFRGVVAMISCVRRVVNLNLIKFGTTVHIVLTDLELGSS